MEKNKNKLTAESLIINAENAVFGRVCSLAAKKALEGNHVIIVNAEKAIITGNASNTIKRYTEIRQKGRSHSLKGPKISRSPFRLLKRGMRGMLPDHKAGIGKQALARIRCFNNLPEEFKNKIMIQLPTNKIKYITLGELSQRI